MSDHAEELKLHAEGLDINSTIRLDCVFCGGGINGDTNTMVLTRIEPMRAVYYCFRNTCNAKGGVDLSGVGRLFSKTKDNTRKELPVFKGDTIPLSSRLDDLCASRYSLGRHILGRYGVRQEAKGGRLVLPVRDTFGSLQGVVLKDLYDTPGLPKSINYLDKPTDKMAWYRTTHPGYVNTLILVEDQLSAIRIVNETNFDSCCLLGTNLTGDQASAISRQGYKKVVIALDRDAFSTSVRMYLEYKGSIEGLVVRHLTKDIKDLPEGTDISEVLSIT